MPYGHFSLYSWFLLQTSSSYCSFYCSFIVVFFAKHNYRVHLRFSVCVCVCVCVCLHDISKSYPSRNMKFEYFVVYGNISDKFDNRHCRIKVKVTVGL